MTHYQGAFPDKVWKTRNQTKLTKDSYGLQKQDEHLPKGYQCFTEFR